jgi:hypothetical protein
MHFEGEAGMATSTDLRSAIEEVQEMLPDSNTGTFDENLDEEWSGKVSARIGALPWWVISSIVHSVLFLLAALITVSVPAPKTDNIIIKSTMKKKEQPKYDPNKKRDIFKQPTEIISKEVQTDKPIVVHEDVEVTDHFETDDNMDTQTANGNEDAISDIPLGGPGSTGSMGVGASGGLAGRFGYRGGGGRKRAIARFGGSPATESAVEAALRWLARHQSADGSWDAAKYESKCPNSRIQVGCTGLSLLAFLGAGHTDRTGMFKDNVKRAIKYLLSVQNKADGRVSVMARGGSGASVGYNHAVGALALAEAYGMSPNSTLRAAAQKAVDYTINVHQVNGGGWRYDPKSSEDTSVTGWFVMQLKSAKIAGLKVSNSGFQGATNFLDRVTNSAGLTGYASSSGTSATMTSVAMVCRQFMGTPNTDHGLKNAGNHLVKFTPQWKDARSHSKERGFYYWYYGTLSMFQMGGKNWKTWNTQMKKILLDNQRKGGPMDGSLEDLDGSWDVESWIDKYGGRVMTTALGALTLEIYYRYLPMYGK